MRFVRLLRAHVDSVIAILLTAAYLAEVARADRAIVGSSFVDGITLDESVGILAGALFLLSLAIRTRLPLVPLALAYGALVLLGRGTLDELLSILLGLALTAYSVGAWAGGRSGQVGALGVGALAGLAVVRAAGGSPEPRDLAAPVFVLVAAWLLGLAARSIRAERGDERVVGELAWEAGNGAPDPAGRDETVRELRDIVERAMSAVILQARNAATSLEEGDAAGARRSLTIIDAAGTEALEETQRLTGELLSPDGAASIEPEPGLADLDELAAAVTSAGLPVATRVEGRAVPLTPDLDGVAYRVVHEALMAALDHAEGATADVIVRYERDELQLEVVDDGVGLDDDVEAQTAGLVAVRDVVVRLGGTLDAGPGDEQGYWVLARLPYEPAWE